SHTAASSKRSGFASRPSAWLRPRPPQPARTARYLAFTPASYATATTLEPFWPADHGLARSASAFLDVTVDRFRARDLARWRPGEERDSRVQVTVKADVVRLDDVDVLRQGSWVAVLGTSDLTKGNAIAL